MERDAFFSFLEPIFVMSTNKERSDHPLNDAHLKWLALLAKYDKMPETYAVLQCDQLIHTDKTRFEGTSMFTWTTHSFSACTI